MPEAITPTAPPVPANHQPDVPPPSMREPGDEAMAALGLLSGEETTTKKRLAPIKMPGIRQEAAGPEPKAAKTFAEQEAESLQRMLDGSEEPKERKTKTRNERGQFESDPNRPANPLSDEDLQTIAPVEKKTAPAADPNAAWTPIELLGAKFETKEQLETRLKVAEGRAAKHQRAEEMAKQASEIAWNWNKYAEGLNKKIEELEGRLQSGNTPQSTPQTTDGELDIAKMPRSWWDGLAQVAEQHGLQHAIYHAVTTTQQKTIAALERKMDARIQQLDARYQQALEENISPIRATTQDIEAEKQERFVQEKSQEVATNLFTQAARVVGQDKQPMYPELSQGVAPDASPEDQEALRTIIGIWKEYDPKFMASPRSIRAAVMEYRATSQRHAQVQSAPPPPDLLDGTGTPPSSLGNGARTPDDAFRRVANATFNPGRSSKSGFNFRF